SPMPAGSLFVFSRAQAKALSLIASDATNDGTYTFNKNLVAGFDPVTRAQTAGKYDFIAVTQHEVTEIMGRIAVEGINFFGQPDYIPGDLYRFSSAGVHQTTSTGAGIYFSIDNGATSQ